MTYQPEPGTADEVQALKVTLDRLVRNVGVLLDVSSVSIGLLDPETGDIVTWATLADSTGGQRHSRFRPNEGIAGWVAAHLEPAIVHDTQQDHRFKPLGNDKLRSLLCIPLIDQDQLLGTLTAGSEQVNAFNEQRQELLQIFTDQAVLAISKTRQAEAAKAQARELGALLDAARALTNSLDSEHAFTYIVGSIRKVIECEDAVIYQYDEHAGVLRVMACIGSRLNDMSGTAISLQDERSMAAWVANQRRARVYAPMDEDVGPVTEALISGEEMSLLCVPLVSKERLQGVIMLSRKEVFRPQELGAMLNLSNTIAATLENVYLYQRARAEREQQAALYSFASDAIVVVDDTLSIIEANIAFATLLGRPLGAILGHRICDLLHFRQSVCMLCGTSPCLLEHALETETLYPHVDCTLPLAQTARSREGESTTEPAELHYIDFSITPVTSTGQRRLLLVGRDVSLYRQFDAMKANFLSTVAHELRGPLQVLNGNLDKLLDLCAKPSDSLPHQEMLRSLRRARAGGETLSALVADLLMIWRLDAGQFYLNLENADLIAVIENAVYELELLAEQQKVSLILELPETIPLIKADTIRIEQVLRNLLTNGIKFTPPGGSVTVSAEVLPDAIEIRVSDTGIGIAPEHQRRIFDRFYQVKSASHDIQRLHGQGLGLSVVHSIVAGHGGSVDVTSVPQHGTTFTVRLPR